MTTKIQLIKTEIDDDPLSRGYSGMTDQQVTDSLNTQDRPLATAVVVAMKQYVFLERHRDNTGTDTTPLFIYGRLRMVMEGNLLDGIFGAIPIINLTADHKASAFAFDKILEQDDETFFLNFNDSRFEQILDDLVSGNVISDNDKTNIMELTDNQQTRGQEIGAGRVRVGNVTEARAI